MGGLQSPLCCEAVHKYAWDTGTPRHRDTGTPARLLVGEKEKASTHVIVYIDGVQYNLFYLFVLVSLTR